MSKTGFVWHERYMWHDTMSAAGTYRIKGDLQPGLHIENAETKRRFKNLLDAYDVTPQLQTLPFGEASDSDLLQFHTPDYVQKIQALSDAQGGDAGEFTSFGPGSAGIARLAVGGTTAAIKAVATGKVDNAYALTRPPGHHAERLAELLEVGDDLGPHAGADLRDRRLHRVVEDRALERRQQVAAQDQRQHLVRREWHVAEAEALDEAVVHPLIALLRHDREARVHQRVEIPVDGAPHAPEIVGELVEPEPDPTLRQPLNQLPLPC